MRVLEIYGRTGRERRGRSIIIYGSSAEKSPIKLQECFYAGHVCKWITRNVTWRKLVEIVNWPGWHGVWKVNNKWEIWPCWVCFLLTLFIEVVSAPRRFLGFSSITWWYVCAWAYRRTNEIDPKTYWLWARVIITVIDGRSRRKSWFPGNNQMILYI